MANLWYDDHIVLIDWDTAQVMQEWSQAEWMSDWAPSEGWEWSVVSEETQYPQYYWDELTGQYLTLEQYYPAYEMMGDEWGYWNYDGDYVLYDTGDTSYVCGIKKNKRVSHI